MLDRARAIGGYCEVRAKTDTKARVLSLHELGEHLPFCVPVFRAQLRSGNPTFRELGLNIMPIITGAGIALERFNFGEA